MELYFRRALQNIAKYGDTDVFPFPVENSIFFDKEDEVVDVLLNIHKNFDALISTDPPFNENRLAPLGYTGFRWVTQLDPLWNAYFLGLILSIADKIEGTRLPALDRSVFSYRYDPNGGSRIFSDIGWHEFHVKSLEIAETANTVLLCDIADFYQRIRHHRLENALIQLEGVGDAPNRILKFLGNFFSTYSHGLPVGGPASRLLSELLLNQTDQLLRFKGIKFCRFADDYHIFAASEEDAFDCFLFLSEKLLNNEGLAIQRAKTRIMSSAEFRHTSPIIKKEEDVNAELSAHNFLAISLRYDPYSPTSEEDYETLRAEIEQFDILGLLSQEIAKTRIDTAVTKQIVKSLKFISVPVRDQAVLSLCDSIDNLYPIFPTLMIVLQDIWPDLQEKTKQSVGKCIRDLFKNKSRLVKTEINQAYACRVLSRENLPENTELFSHLFVNTESPMVKRDVLLAMFNWRNWPWISDLRSQFRTFSPPLRRGFIIASYSLREEGKHWRTHNKAGFSSFEKVVQEWASAKAQEHNNDKWEVPL